MRFHHLEKMSLQDRRRFLKLMTSLFGVSAFSSLDLILKEILFGKTFAQSAADTEIVNLIEVNLRDQWDFSHAFIPPGVASRAGEISVGGDDIPMFLNAGQISQEANNFYLGPDSRELRPHLDNVAVCEMIEPVQGRIHGHEAANPIRCARRSVASQRSGYQELWRADKPRFSAGTQDGNEPCYGRTPTFDCLHNYYIKKKLGAEVRNGVILKGMVRGHTAYHYDHNLAGGQLTRYRQVSDLLAAFPDTTVGGSRILASERDAELVVEMVKKIDKKYFTRTKRGEEAFSQHSRQLEDAVSRLGLQARPFSLPLTAEERAYWSNGVPNQNFSNTISDGNYNGRTQINIWEQMAYAFKLIESGTVRTVSLEFDYVDDHSPNASRQRQIIPVMAKQSAIPLARLITRLKEAGIFDKTLVVLNSTDGSRGYYFRSGDPNRLKNSMVLAGGMIQGGYYGDLRVSGSGSNQGYSYVSPDLTTGNPGPRYDPRDASRRISGSVAYRTIAEALKIPAAEINQFPDARANPMRFMLRS